MSNTNVPKKQPEDDDQQSEANSLPSNQNDEVQQRSDTPLTPSHTHNTRNRNKPRAPAVLTKQAKVTKKPAPARKPVRKPTTTRRTRDESQASHNDDDDEGQNVRPAKPNITVRRMSKKITKLVEQSDDVAESYIAFLEWFTKGNGKEVERLREWLGKRTKNRAEEYGEEGRGRSRVRAG
jgi:hypothetical protein